MEEQRVMGCPMLPSAPEALPLAIFCTMKKAYSCSTVPTLKGHVLSQDAVSFWSQVC